MQSHDKLDEICLELPPILGRCRSYHRKQLSYCRVRKEKNAIIDRAGLIMLRQTELKGEAVSRSGTGQEVSNQQYEGETL